MDGGLTGYGLYWKRIARHISLSEAAKQVGVRASELSAFERGTTHTLSDEQISNYNAYLDSITVEEAPDPETAAET